MKPFFVGDGLVQRTAEDCQFEGLNPNPNPSGEINLPTDPNVMLDHIKKSQAVALRSLQTV